MYIRFIGVFTLLCLFACQSDTGNKSSNLATTRFILHKTADCGLNFVPTIVEDYRYNFSMDPYIYNGGGVAVLDVNNDGLQDLFFTARLQGCQLYLNKGNLKFENISEKSGVSKHGGLKTGVTVVDINADGWQDLYVCRTWLQPLPERRNLLLVNNHDGTFTDQAAQYGLDDISASQQGNFFDYDKDGDLDLYLMNHPVDFRSITLTDFLPTADCKEARCQAPKNEYESDRLYRNNGNGKFEDVSKTAGIWNRAFGLSVLTSDFNDDGYPDVFVGNDFVMPDFLYINNQKGGFTEQAPSFFRHTSNHSMGADVADFNGDGLQDLVVLDMLAEPWARRRKLMSTMILERYKTLEEKGYGRQMMRNTLQINNGNNTYSELGCLAGMEASDWSWAPLAADYDNDGFRDLFVANGIYRDLNDADFFLFTADSINRTGGISAKRFNSFEQFAGLMPSTPVHPYMFRNTGQYPWENVSESWGFTQKGFANGAAYADLDNDGDLDLVTNNMNAAPSLYENTAANVKKQHWLQIKCKGTAQNPFGLGAKVRVYAGGKLVFTQELLNVRGYYSSVEPIWQVGLGDNTRVDRIEIGWMEGKMEEKTQVQADQRIVLDISQAKTGVLPPLEQAQSPVFEAFDPGFQFVHRENKFEDLNTERLLPRRYSNQGPCIAVGDLNGDGQDDVFIGGAADQAGGIWLQQRGKWARKTESALDADAVFEDTGCLFFDADQDKDLDLYVVSGGNEQPAGSAMYQDRLYLNDGKGNFSRANGAIPEERSSGAAVAALDYDKDGDPDLFVGGSISPGYYPKAPQSMVLKNENGRFLDVTAQIAPDLANLGMVRGLAFADLDQDRAPELIVCGEWMAISVFKFESGKWVNQTKQWGLEKSSGWWNCVVAADVNQDGKPDILAGNQGLNCRFRTSPEHPLALYAADFDHNGSMDPVMAMAWGNSYFPVAQRADLAAQMPVLMNKKYQRNTAFAQCNLNDLLPDKNAALHLEARELASGWFENTGTQFVFHPFPTAMQTAPINGMLAEDVNQDGMIDVLAVGNRYGNEVETGRLDAFNGAVLLGSKTGLQYETNRASGFWAMGEARSIVSAKLNKQGILLIANCNGVPQGYRAQKTK